MTDRAFISELFQRVTPNVIIHFANPRFDAPGDVIQEVNIDGTRFLVDVCEG